MQPARKATLRSLVLLAAISLVLIGLGESLRALADANAALQRKWITNELYFDAESGASFGQSDDGAVRLLTRNEFYTREVAEPAVVVEAKKSVPRLGNGHYFDTVWNFITYVEILGEKEELAASLEEIIALGGFADTTRCRGASECKPTDSEVNVIPTHMRELFQLLDRAFVRPSIRAYLAGNRDSATRLADLALDIGYLIHTNTDRRFYYYDALLVLATFIADQPDGEPSYSSDDLYTLIQLVSDEYTEGFSVEHDPANATIAAYVAGITKLRSGCLVEASRVFEAAAMSAVERPATAELFAFLAIRAAARPFMFPEKLVPSETDDSGLAHNGCGTSIGLGELRTHFLLVEENLRAIAFTHHGFSADTVLFHESVMMDEPGYETVVSERERRLRIEQLKMVQLRMEKLRAQRLRAAELNSGEARGENANVIEEAPRECDQVSLAAAINRSLGEEVDLPQPDFRWPLPELPSLPAEPAKNGIDMPTRQGAAVRAVDDGRVTFICVDGSVSTVVLRHGHDLASVYSALVGSDLRLRRLVERGEVIGGAATEMLHFELWGKDGPIDAMASLGPRGRPNLQRPPEPTPPPPPPEVSDEVVEAAQAGLIELHFLHGTAGGPVGKKTTNAVEDFQEYYGYVVDGLISENLIMQLRSKGAKAEMPKSPSGD
jgi:hypothetical protein